MGYICLYTFDCVYIQYCLPGNDSEKAEKDTIAANGIPDMDDIPAINATNDNTAKNTAESTATVTEDNTASAPIADAPATDTNAESR